MPERILFYDVTDTVVANKMFADDFHESLFIGISDSKIANLIKYLHSSPSLLPSGVHGKIF